MYSERPFRLLLAVLSLTSILCACSVREDRSGCPCFLTLDLSGLDAETLADSGCEELVWTLMSGDTCIGGRIPVDDLPEEQLVEVPREDAFLYVLAGDEGLFVPGEGLVIPSGSESPRLYAFAAAVETSRPELSVPICLHKRYARLEIRFREALRPGTECRLLGEVCGYDPMAEPLPGVFSFPVVPDRNGRCEVVLPAQADGSLLLCLYRNGELERAFSLGTYILESGYAWEAEDLEDISLEIDYLHAPVRYKVEQWKKTLVFSIAV